MKKIAFLSFILITFQTPARSEGCADPGLLRVFDQLTEVGRLHNCRIEFVKHESENTITYNGYAEDLTPSITNHSPELTFSYTFDRNCPVSDILPKYSRLQTSYGYSSPISNFRVSVRVEMGSADLPVLTIFQKIDLSTHEIIERLNCGRIEGI